MSLLSICQDVADVIGLTRPTAIVTGTDQLARQMLGIAKEVLEELSLMDWPALQVPYEFSTVVGQSSYTMPADFERATTDTAFIASQYYQMRGALSPGDWANQRNQMEAQTGRSKFRIFGTPLKLYMTPTPQTVETVVLEYQTTNRVRRLDGTYGATFAADDDTPVVPEDLMKRGIKWRTRHAKGLDYSEEFNAYELARSARLAQALAFGSMPVAYRSGIDCDEPAFGYVPQTGFGS